MFSSVYVATPPALEPITVGLARLHMRVDQDSDDELIAMYITAARTWVEQYLGRALISQQLLWTVSQNDPRTSYQYVSLPLSLLVLPQWFDWRLLQRGYLQLPWQPVISVDQVSYGQFGQPDTVLTAGTDYDVDPVSAALRIHPASQVIPNDHLKVLFTAGYGAMASLLPQPIVTAILMLATHFYENRGDTPAEAPSAVDLLLAPYRIIRFG